MIAFKKKLSTYVLLAATFLSPFVFLNIRSLTIYDVLVMATFILLIFEKEEIFFNKRLLYLVLFLSLAALMSTFRSSEQVQSIITLLQICFVFFIQLSVYKTIIKRETASTVYKALVFSISFLIISSMLLLITDNSIKRFSSFYENPNRFAYIVLLGLPFLYTWFLREAKMFKKTIKFLLILMGWGLIIVSLSRSAWIALFSSLVVYIVLMKAPEISFNSLVKPTIKYITVVMFITLILFAFLVPQSVKARVYSSLYWDSPEIQDRVVLFKAAFKALPDYLFVGSGLDNFHYVMEDYRVDSPYFRHRKPHNFFLLYLLQTGVIGFMSIIGIVLYFYIKTYRVLRKSVKDDLNYKLLVASITAFTALIIAGMFITQITIRYYWFFFCLGISISALIESRLPEGEVVS